MGNIGWMEGVPPIEPESGLGGLRDCYAQVGRALAALLLGLGRLCGRRVDGGPSGHKGEAPEGDGCSAVCAAGADSQKGAGACGTGHWLAGSSRRW